MPNAIDGKLKSNRPNGSKSALDELLCPSDFTKMPMDSVLQKTEAEIVARNIMVMLSRTGNTFRELTWEEYEQEREKDGGRPWNEKAYFEKTIGYCKSPETAALFSKAWA